MGANKSIINIAFDWDEQQYHKSVKRYYDFLHYKPITGANGVSMAKSKTDLLNLIGAYLNHQNKKGTRTGKNTKGYVGR